MAAIMPAGLPAFAQIAAPTDFPLLWPSLDGNPQRPPVFRKTSPQASVVATTSSVEQLTNFEYQPAIGAGSTGFKSGKVRSKTPRHSQQLGAAATAPGASR